MGLLSSGVYFSQLQKQHTCPAKYRLGLGLTACSTVGPDRAGLSCLKATQCGLGGSRGHQRLSDQGSLSLSPTCIQTSNTRDRTPPTPGRENSEVMAPPTPKELIIWALGHKHLEEPSPGFQPCLHEKELSREPQPPASPIGRRGTSWRSHRLHPYRLEEEVDRQ